MDGNWAQEVVNRAGAASQQVGLTLWAGSCGVLAWPCLIIACGYCACCFKPQSAAIGVVTLPLLPPLSTNILCKFGHAE